MGLFGFKKSLETQFKILAEDFLRMSKKISDQDLEIEKLKTHMFSLRGLINRKLGSDLGISEKETSKSIDGLDELRKK